MGTLSGKTALITGASRGIGEATARLFAAEGANVVLTARGIDDIRRIAAEIGPQALAVPCDVADFAQVDTAVQAALSTFGGLDILIGNAGVIEPVSHLADADPEGWGRAIDINLKGVFHGMRAAMPVMQSAGGGTIITISSGAAHSPLEGWSHYCSSKAGAAMLTRCADMEGRDKGLRIMGLSPGTVATQMQREIKATGINPVSQLDWSDHIPPEWPAQCLLWMCTPDADDWLGQEISLRDESIRKRLGLSR
ncbi:SDR family oxidoreductase [Lutimaribacter saemankumensis]|uniref:NADP-dependent 3-hydroxy acid dehydrogenase YdfG n=1 Tax=Lutimaribacter saemankumensis TaxID=490829 RepID=A0A1G8QB31_9RHOB|nr:SDR family oxidoreductase [Lutimaribacter saemankumensis]SDJ01763.1 NADP-dependent 3-hydroxy acid dehydrogenase YdfG [Lutimaribacter saemankumensis]